MVVDKINLHAEYKIEQLEMWSKKYSTNSTKVYFSIVPRAPQTPLCHMETHSFSTFNPVGPT